MNSDDPTYEVVKYGFSSHAYYVRCTRGDLTLHGLPWQTEWAAERDMRYKMRGWYEGLVKQGRTGNGDWCPLFAEEHGRMWTLPHKPGEPPKQFCPHVDHDGRGMGDRRIPQSRAIWPVHGFKDTVDTYLARLDRAIRDAGAPDLSDLEVPQ